VHGGRAGKLHGRAASGVSPAAHYRGGWRGICRLGLLSTDCTVEAPGLRYLPSHPLLPRHRLPGWQKAGHRPANARPAGYPLAAAAACGCVLLLTSAIHPAPAQPGPPVLRALPAAAPAVLCWPAPGLRSSTLGVAGSSSGSAAAAVPAGWRQHRQVQPGVLQGVQV
jgi:hypothetical protein